MKKTLTKRIGVLLLALVMLTSCFVGGTFAKYVTSVNLGGNSSYNGNSGDGSSARVAKWGVNATIGTTGTGEDGTSNLELFKKQYTTDDTSNETNVGEYSVVATDYVVAPGTGNVSKGADNKVTGGAVNIKLSGTPEVAGKIEVKANIALKGDWTVKVGEGTTGTFYCPLIFYVNGEKVDGSDYTSKDALVSALSEKVQIIYFKAGQDLSQLTNGTSGEGDAEDISIVIGWEWPFERGENETAVAANDAKDTALAESAATANADGDTTNDIYVACTANLVFTQID